MSTKCFNEKKMLLDFGEIVSRYVSVDSMKKKVSKKGISLLVEYSESYQKKKMLSKSEHKFFYRQKLFC